MKPSRAPRGARELKLCAPVQCPLTARRAPRGARELKPNGIPQPGTALTVVLREGHVN